MQLFTVHTVELSEFFYNFVILSKIFHGSWKIHSVKHKTKHKQIEGRKIIRQHFSAQSYHCQFSTIVDKIVDKVVS